MYADFIEDRLAENSEYIRLLKLGLKSFKPIWLEDNFRQIIKYDSYQLINTFFKNVKQQYTDEEKLFIYKSVYSQAGFRDSMKVLASFIEGFDLKISDNVGDNDIDSNNTGGVTNRLANSNTDGLDPICIEGRLPLQFKLEETGEYSKDLSLDVPTIFHYTVSGTEHSEALSQSQKVLINIGKASFLENINILTEVRNGKTVLLFNGTPYINAFIDTGVPFNFTDTTGQVLQNFDNWEEDSNKDYILKKDVIASESIGSDMYYIELKDATVIIPSNISVYNASDLFYVSRVIDRLRKAYLILSDFSKTKPCLSKHILQQYETTYTFDFLPYVHATGPQGDVDIPSISVIAYTYKVEMSTDKEVFYDYDLASSQIHALMRELLYYMGEEFAKINFTGITFNNMLTNTVNNNLSISMKAYRFAVITDKNNFTSYEYNTDGQTITVEQMGSDIIVST